MTKDMNLTQLLEDWINSQYELGITDLELRQHQEGVEIPVLSKTALVRDLPSLLAKIEQHVLKARKDELKKMVKEWGYGEYPSNDPRHGLDWEGWADYRTAQLDALLNTKGQDND